MTGGGRDRGSGTVLVIAVLAVAVLLVGALGLLAGAQRARARAQSAADLGALAAADRALRGRPDPCGTAGDVVERNGAVLAGCAVEPGAVVAVTATVATAVGEARADARAGPRPTRGRSPHHAVPQVRLAREA